MKKIMSVIMVIALVLSLFSTNAFAEDAKAKVYIAKTEAYEVKKDETKIYVPIMVEGNIDMQCYDITVTYDKSLLDVVAEETVVELPDGEYTYGVVNTGTNGMIRFSGMTVEESAETATGQIGTICFTSAKRVSKDNIEIALGLEVIELGFGTEVADIEVVADGLVVLNKSPKATDSPGDLILLGDVNADTKRNAQDALEILKHAAKITTLEGNALIAADANRDEKINSADALAVLKHAAGIETLH